MWKRWQLFLERPELSALSFVFITVKIPEKGRRQEANLTTHKKSI